MNNPDYSQAIELFSLVTPENCRISISRDLTDISKDYVIRATYTKGNIIFSVNCKARILPTEQGELLMYYARQIILNQSEQRIHYFKVYNLEKQARQNSFLYENKNVRVSDKTMEKGKLMFS